MSSPPEQEAVTLYRAPTGLHGADQWREVPVPWRADRMRERSNYEVEQFVPLARLEAAEARARKAEEALAELAHAVKPMLGTMNFYFGPGARTAVSYESRDAFLRIRDATNAALATIREGA